MPAGAWPGFAGKVAAGCVSLLGDADETAPDGSGCGFGSVFRVQLGEATGYVVAGRFVADEEA